jgi:prepilin-type N-terminal cleavage/methylation domain-containing protein
MNDRGLSFIEILIALTIFSVAMVGQFQFFNVSLDAQLRAKQEIISTHLAVGLMAEIMAKNFAEDTGDSYALGPDTGETGRSIFDDIDDYHNLDETPPVTIGGLLLDGSGGRPNYTGFRRRVTVWYCSITGTTINCASSEPKSSYKQVTVTLSGPHVKDIIVKQLKSKP